MIIYSFTEGQQKPNRRAKWSITLLKKVNRKQTEGLNGHLPCYNGQQKQTEGLNGQLPYYKGQQKQTEGLNAQLPYYKGQQKQTERLNGQQWRLSLSAWSYCALL